MLLPVASLLLAIPEPCYGLEGQMQLEGEHVWAEYDAPLSDTQAMRMLQAADDAWNIYVDDLGWTPPSSAMAVRADLTADMAAGQCITLACGDEHVPFCHVFGPAFDSGSFEATTAHEIGHAFEYALMGSYVDSLTSWAWWMEGSAEWLATFYADDGSAWYSIGNYAGNPQWALHNDFSEMVTGNRGSHMYGTAVIAFFLAEYYGGPDTVRQIWEWGAERSGERIFFPDAIDGVGLDFAEVWPHFLAVITVIDIEGGEQVDQIPGHVVISELPGSGAPPPESRPEGLGLGIVRIPAGLGMPEMDLRVQVDGDASVPWHAALAKTDGALPGSRVLEYVVGEFDDAGHAELLLPAFDGNAEAFLAVSPESIEHTPFDYTVTAELVPSGGGESSSGSGSTTAPDVTTSSSSNTGDNTDTDDTTPAREDDNTGCGCRSTGNASWLLLLIPALVGSRRAGRSRAVRRPSSPVR